MAAVGEGTSVFGENIFENRYRHTEGLCHMGAKIKVEGKVAVVEGVPELSGAAVEAMDLRGGAALIVAGLCARGSTRVRGMEYVKRGYEGIEEKLASLGARVKVFEGRMTS